MKKLIALCLIIFISYSTAYPLSACRKNAFRQGERYTDKGYDIRYGYYYAKSQYETGHMWCEWYDGKEWRIAKDTIQRNYVADWYGYPHTNVVKKSD